MANTPGWDDLTARTLSEITSQFQPGLQLDEEFIEPLWVQAVAAVRDYRENMQMDRDEMVDEYDHDRAREAARDRVIGACELIFYGQTRMEAL